MSEPGPRQEPHDAILRLSAKERMPDSPPRVAVVTGVRTLSPRFTDEREKLGRLWKLLCAQEDQIDHWSDSGMAAR
jgi:hypothetical protein